MCVTINNQTLEIVEQYKYWDTTSEGQLDCPTWATIGKAQLDSLKSENTTESKEESAHVHSISCDIWA